MRVFLYFLTAVVLGCHSPTPTIQPTPLETTRVRVVEDQLGWFDDTIPIVRFRPPFAYGYWRLQVEACAGVTKDGWPKFFMAPISPLRADYAIGLFASRSNSIIFAFGAETQPWVVRHEILHWLLYPINTKDHPPEHFGPQSPCGSLVNIPPAGSN